MELPLDAVVYPLVEAAERRLHLKATKVGELVASGEIKTFKIGGRRFVTEAEIQRFIRKQITAAAKKMAPVSPEASARAKRAAAVSVRVREENRRRRVAA